MSSEVRDMAEEGGVDEAGRRCFSFNFKKGHFSIFHWFSDQNEPFFIV